ncbi:MAG: diacylglycerol kinase family protein [Minisyncoccia bacterium]
MASEIQRGISFKKLIKSIKNAFSGFKIAILEEQTFKIQVFIGIFTIILAFYFQLSVYLMLVLFLIIIIVLSLELLNSQIERILDFLNPNNDPKIKRIKDLSASAVLLTSLGSIIIGLLIFFPYILKYFNLKLKIWK